LCFGKRGHYIGRRPHLLAYSSLYCIQRTRTCGWLISCGQPGGCRLQADGLDLQQPGRRVMDCKSALVDLGEEGLLDVQATSFLIAYCHFGDLLFFDVADASLSLSFGD